MGPSTPLCAPPHNCKASCSCLVCPLVGSCLFGGCVVFWGRNAHVLVLVPFRFRPSNCPVSVSSLAPLLPPPLGWGASSRRLFVFDDYCLKAQALCLTTDDAPLPPFIPPHPRPLLLFVGWVPASLLFFFFFFFVLFLSLRRPRDKDQAKKAHYTHHSLLGTDGSLS